MGNTRAETTTSANHQRVITYSSSPPPYTHLGDAPHTFSHTFFFHSGPMSTAVVAASPSVAQRSSTVAASSQPEAQLRRLADTLVTQQSRDLTQLGTRSVAVAAAEVALTVLSEAIQTAIQDKAALESLVEAEASSVASRQKLLGSLEGAVAAVEAERAVCSQVCDVSRLLVERLGASAADPAEERDPPSGAAAHVSLQDCLSAAQRFSACRLTGKTAADVTRDAMEHARLEADARAAWRELGAATPIPTTDGADQWIQQLARTCADVSMAQKAPRRTLPATHTSLSSGEHQTTEVPQATTPSTRLPSFSSGNGRGGAATHRTILGTCGDAPMPPPPDFVSVQQAHLDAAQEASTGGSLPNVSEVEDCLCGGHISAATAWCDSLTSKAQTALEATDQMLRSSQAGHLDDLAVRNFGDRLTAARAAWEGVVLVKRQVNELLSLEAQLSAQEDEALRQAADLLSLAMQADAEEATQTTPQLKVMKGMLVEGTVQRDDVAQDVAGIAERVAQAIVERDGLHAQSEDARERVRSLESAVAALEADREKAAKQYAAWSAAEAEKAAVLTSRMAELDAAMAKARSELETSEQAVSTRSAEVAANLKRCQSLLPGTATGEAALPGDASELNVPKKVETLERDIDALKQRLSTHVSLEETRAQFRQRDRENAESALLEATAAAAAWASWKPQVPSSSFVTASDIEQQ